jgi:hypothetical protein
MAPNYDELNRLIEAAEMKFKEAKCPTAIYFKATEDGLLEISWSKQHQGKWRLLYSLDGVEYLPLHEASLAVRCQLALFVHLLYGEIEPARAAFSKEVEKAINYLRKFTETKREE